MIIFRFKACLAGTMLLAGCTDADFKLDCKIPRDASGKAIVSLADFSEVTKFLVEEIDGLKTELKADAGLVGFNGSIARKFAGTESYSFALRMNTLRSAVARQKARQLALTNDGDTLLGTSQQWQCQNFADSVASLDVGQNQRQLLENMESIKDQFQSFGKSLDFGTESNAK
jgi:hypothetical protein